MITITQLLIISAIIVNNSDINANETDKSGLPIIQFHQNRPDAPGIDAQSTKKLFNEGKLILVDSIETEVYARRHIYGSISVPKKVIEKELVELPRNKIIAFYCG